MAVSKIFAVLWEIFQPLLFGLIGAEIDIMKIDGKTIGYGIAVLAIGLVLRMIASFLAVFGTGKKKTFYVVPLIILHENAHVSNLSRGDFDFDIVLSDLYLYR